MSTIFRLFILSGLFLIQPLAAEIYELQLAIDKMVCPYCAKVVVEDLKTINGVESVKIWPQEGLGLLGWKNDVPFQLSLLCRTFARTDFKLQHITIDVEGVIERRRGSMTLRSEPDNSIFYITNAECPRVVDLQEGQLIRLRGLGRNQQGLNMLTITDILPPV